MFDAKYEVDIQRLRSIRIVRDVEVGTVHAVHISRVHSTPVIPRAVEALKSHVSTSREGTPYKE